MEYPFVIIVDWTAFASEKELENLVIEENTILMQMILFDKFETAKPTIDSLYSNEYINFILVIDRNKNICHIYKFNEELEEFKEIKENILKEAQRTLEKLVDEKLIMPAKFNDLREFMKMGGHKAKIRS